MFYYQLTLNKYLTTLEATIYDHSKCGKRCIEAKNEAAIISFSPQKAAFPLLPRTKEKTL